MSTLSPRDATLVMSTLSLALLFVLVACSQGDELIPADDGDAGTVIRHIHR